MADDDTQIFDVRFYKLPDPTFSKGFRWLFLFKLPGTADAAENVNVDFDIYYIPSIMVDAN